MSVIPANAGIHCSGMTCSRTIVIPANAGIHCSKIRA